MNRIVLDTNVWLSALFWAGPSRKIIQYAENDTVEILVSREILLEIVNVLQKEAKFQRFLEECKEKIQDLIIFIIQRSTFVDAKSKINTVKEDKNDNKFIECAFDGKANIILSHDHHLLNIRKFNGIKIMKPEEFLAEAQRLHNDK